MKTTLPAIAILACFALSNGASVDSVTVDSVWNSDSSWYDGNGVLQQRSARDCFVSFIPGDSGYASCSLAVSLDSGKTWGADPDPLKILDSGLSKPIPCGQKKRIKARVFGIDRSNAVFKIKADICTYTLGTLQKAYTDMKFGMFVYFNMSTFDRYTMHSVSGEWGLANTDEKIFRPSALNCGQWADVAKSAGCKYMVLTTKHQDGFCLWPSRYTTHSVANATVKTDVVKQFADSARSRGMKVGFYYSIRDLTNGYATAFVKGQLSELLTQYGEITCLWFDGWGWGPGYNKVPYDTVRDLVKGLQPRCLMIENNHKYAMDHTEIVEYEMPIDGPPGATNTLPAEGCQVIRSAPDHCWFWHPIDECTMMPAQTIVDELTINNARHAAYLFDVTPDTTGRVPQCQADRMKEVGKLRGATQ